MQAFLSLRPGLSSPVSAQMTSPQATTCDFHEDRSVLPTLELLPVVSRDTWHNLHLLEFVKARLVTQHTTYPRECSMCAWEECVFWGCWTHICIRLLGPLGLQQGSPASVSIQACLEPATQWEGSLNTVHLNHPKPSLVCEKTVFHKTGPWCQEGGDRCSVAQFCCLLTSRLGALSSVSPGELWRSLLYRMEVPTAQLLFSRSSTNIGFKYRTF